MAAEDNNKHPFRTLVEIVTPADTAPDNFSP